MSKPQFVYVTYIKTTPEKLWAALTEPGFTKQYWFGADIEADWKAGSKWRIMLPDGRIADSGVILECDPPRRLVIDKWQNQFVPEAMAAGPSRCTMELEQADGAVKLTVTHVSEGDNDALIKGVSGGWPRILSNLKSLLETGEIALRSKPAK
jgi:uncharacterized protein YndB with AHSA1/START domain